MIESIKKSKTNEREFIENYTISVLPINKRYCINIEKTLIVFYEEL